MKQGIRRGIYFILIIAAGAAVWFWIFRSLWLIQAHGDEVEDAILRYEKIDPSLDACLDPAVLVQVATGAELAYRQKTRGTGTICHVREQPGVCLVRIREYSSTCAKIVAERWHLRVYSVDLTTLDVLSGTYHINATYATPAPMFTDRLTYILVRESVDSDWKVAYRVPHSVYMSAKEWFSIPDCSNVPTVYPTYED